MNKSLLFLTLAMSFFMTSCFDMVEEIYLNRNGSGKYVYTIDMSSLMSDPMMGQIMAQSMNEQMGTETLEIDSVIRFSEMEQAPASFTAEEKALFNKIEMNLLMSQSKGKGIITISFPFDKMSQVNQFNALLSKLQNEGDGGSLGMAGMGMSPITSEFSVNGKTFNRKTTSTGKPSDQMDEETLSMARMMFTEATLKTIYHLPGRVRSTTLKEAAVDGKTVTTTFNLMDILDGNVDYNGQIKFK